MGIEVFVELCKILLKEAELGKLDIRYRICTERAENVFVCNELTVICWAVM